MSDIDGEAMKHLGNVLVLLAELHPDDRTKGLNKAMTFFNEHNPTWQIEPVEGYSSRLVTTGPATFQRT